MAGIVGWGWMDALTTVDCRIADVVESPASLLGVDFGTAFTKAALFERVDGRYRLIARGVARTTLDTHIFDGLGRACAQIEQLTGRQLFVQGEPVTGDVAGNRGVEELAACLSCQVPPNVLALDDDSAAAARRCFCSVVELAGSEPDEWLRQIAARQWDAVVGPSDELEDIQALLPSFRRAEPHRADHPDDRLASGLGPLLVAGDAQAIEQTLNELSRERARETVAGAAELASVATQPLTVTWSALGSLANLIASRFSLRLAVADVGAASATLALGDGGSSGNVRMGLGPGLPLPASVEELGESHRRAEDCLRRVARRLNVDLLVGTGGVFANTPRWSQAALILLNGGNPEGVTQLAVDNSGIVSQVAALAASFPEVATDVMELDALVPLGTVVRLEGKARAGAEALQVKWTEGQEEVGHSVLAGDLTRLDLPPGFQREVRLFPTPQVDVGFGRPGAPASTRVGGGWVGLVIDARLGADGDAERRRHWERRLERRT